MLPINFSELRMYPYASEDLNPSGIAKPEN